MVYVCTVHVPFSTYRDNERVKQLSHIGLHCTVLYCTYCPVPQIFFFNQHTPANSKPFRVSFFFSPSFSCCISTLYDPPPILNSCLPSLPRVPLLRRLPMSVLFSAQRPCCHWVPPVYSLRWTDVTGHAVLGMFRWSFPRW